MAQRTGFKNIQIQAKPELFDLYEDTYSQSGTNSKGEFQRMLLENYLNPEDSNLSGLKQAQENLKNLEEEKKILSFRLALYETDGMKEILEKHKGEKLVFKNVTGKKMTIEINDLPDVFSAIFNSVKIN